MNWIDGIFKAIKLPLKVIFGIVLLISILFILPENILLYLGINPILTSYRGYFSLTLIGGLIYLIMNFVIYIYNYIKKDISKNRNEIQVAMKIEKAKNELSLLDEIEKGVIREYAFTGYNTIELPVTNATVSALLSKNILVLAGNYTKQTIFGILKSLKLNEAIIKELRPRMIGIDKDSFDQISEMKEREIKILSEQRPSFILELERFRKYLG